MIALVGGVLLYAFVRWIVRDVGVLAFLVMCLLVAVFA